jgi:hypothetical protein
MRQSTTLPRGEFDRDKTDAIVPSDYEGLTTFSAQGLARDNHKCSICKRCFDFDDRVYSNPAHIDDIYCTDCVLAIVW